MLISRRACVPKYLEVGAMQRKQESVFENGEEVRIRLAVVEFLPQDLEHGRGALRVDVIKAAVALSQLLLVLDADLREVRMNE